MIARTLDHRVVLRTAEHELFPALQYLACAPDMAGGEAADLTICIERFRQWYRIVEDGAPAREVFDAKGAVDYLHGRLLAIAVEERPSEAVLHAASLKHRGRRVLLLGGKGVGKTTLALRMARAGYSIEGDEHVFVAADGVVARPRACRVKDSALQLLVDMADIIARSPSYELDLGQKIFNVDPRQVCGEWRIDRGPVHCIIVLRANHGGYSSIRPVKPLLLAQSLMAELAARDPRRAVAAVAALASRVQAFDLSLGDLDGAVWYIDRLLEDQASRGGHRTR